MRMIFTLAWRNIWRHKTRSLIVMAAIVSGIWAGVFTNGLMFGITNSRMKAILDGQIGHIQVHHPQYRETQDPAFFIESTQLVEQGLEKEDSVKAFTSRMVIPGMINSARNASGVLIRGIDPEKEAPFTFADEQMIEGDFFQTPTRTPIVIGQKLAEKLQVSIRSRIVVSFQDTEGNITGAGFRVAGIFKTTSTKFDQTQVFVLRQDLDPIAGTKGNSHQIALQMPNHRHPEGLAQRLKEQFPDLKIETWKELSPELDWTDALMDQYLLILMAIIMLALAFGIINTMLMAVLERVREIGMLMAVGMNRKKVFLLLLTESIFLTIAAAPFGAFAGWLTIYLTGKTGLDLSNLAAGLEQYDMDPILYPALEWSFYPQLAVLVVITGIFAGLYPAWKAIRLKPVEAIRKT